MDVSRQRCPFAGPNSYSGGINPIYAQMSHLAYHTQKHSGGIIDSRPPSTIYGGINNMDSTIYVTSISVWLSKTTPSRESLQPDPLRTGTL